MKKMLSKIALGCVSISSLCYADLREDYSKVYSYRELNRGSLIEGEDLPQSVQDEIDARDNYDDVNARMIVKFDRTVYKVVSFGTKEWGNADDYVLAVFDQGGTFIGRCITELSKRCELKVED